MVTRKISEEDKQFDRSNKPFECLRMFLDPGIFSQGLRQKHISICRELSCVRRNYTVKCANYSRIKLVAVYSPSCRYADRLSYIQVERFIIPRTGFSTKQILLGCGNLYRNDKLSNKFTTTKRAVRCSQNGKYSNWN